MPREWQEFPDRIVVTYDNVPGESLRKFIVQQAPVATAGFLPIAIALVKLVQQIHQSGWIIKNLCPENIILSLSENKCFLTDVTECNPGVQERTCTYHA